MTTVVYTGTDPLFVVGHGTLRPGEPADLPDTLAGMLLRRPDMTKITPKSTKK